MFVCCFPWKSNLHIQRRTSTALIFKNSHPSITKDDGDDSIKVQYVKNKDSPMDRAYVRNSTEEKGLCIATHITAPLTARAI